MFKFPKYNFLSCCLTVLSEQWKKHIHSDMIKCNGKILCLLIYIGDLQLGEHKPYEYHYLRREKNSLFDDRNAAIKSDED